MAKVKTELIDAHISPSQCKKAIIALTEHATKVTKQREENELLPGKEENVWLVLSVKKTTPEKKLKPHKIPLVHPIVDPRITPVCLITKDPQREYKDLLESHNIKFISRVVGITKLKGKFKPFEARRMLMKENGLFLADERVVPLLPGLLGKIFFDAKKQPIPVSLTKKDLKGELERAVSSTFMHQNQGTCTSVKIGIITQSPEHILDNLKTALPAIVKRIEGGWDNIQSFHVKTNSSVSLPIWACNLGEGDGGRWEAKAAVSEENWAGFGEEKKNAEESESEKEEELPQKENAKKKGKKRTAEEKNEQPSKKVKKSDLKAKSPDEEGTSGKPTKKKKDDETPSALASKSKTTPEVNNETPEKAKKDKKGKAPSTTSITLDDDRSSPKVTKSVKSSKTSVTKAHSPIPSSLVRNTSNHTTSTITPEELKKKKAGTGLEKKKEKLARGKSGGSMKESVVGKKSKARI
ncbi:ribosomal protein L1 [Phellopilus nigrolimitatus]|nr:ribosomal protein L1 [Phellopilus nigrolimitatus]